MDSQDTINNEFSKSREDIVKYANDQIHQYLFQNGEKTSSIVFDDKNFQE